MTPLEMIAEWRAGCSDATAEHPELCHCCTVALIDALEAKLRAEPAVMVPQHPVEAAVMTYNYNYNWDAIGLFARECAIVSERGQPSQWADNTGRTYWLLSIDLQQGNTFLRLQNIALPMINVLVPLHEFRAHFHRVQ
jgi:hypothetical protein